VAPLGFDVKVLDANKATGKFTLFGNPKAISTFRQQDCRTPMPLLAMQPRASLLRTGVRNANASRVN
jgi:hypothetical protein